MKILQPLKILFFTFALFQLISCEHSTGPVETQKTLRLVRTLTVTMPSQNFWREFPGVVDAAQKAELGFRITGKLKKLLANEGDLVKKNQLLAQLDATDQNIQLKSRQAEYNQAHGDFDRGRTLIKKNLISRSDFNKLQAQNATAKANLETAKQNLEYTFLRAPFNGRIAKRYIENYEEVSAMQVVYALQDLSSMTIKVDVPESVMILVREGGKPEVNAIFDAIPDQQFPLSLKEVSSQADKDTNTFEVTFSMPAIEGYNVLPGMSVTVRGQRDPDRAVDNGNVFVPAHAVLGDREGRFVYLVAVSGDAKGIVERRAVETGDLSNLGIEIISGLTVGDKVITAGMSKMSSGLEVRLAREIEN